MKVRDFDDAVSCLEELINDTDSRSRIEQFITHELEDVIYFCNEAKARIAELEQEVEDLKAVGESA